MGGEFTPLTKETSSLASALKPITTAATNRRHSLSHQTTIGLTLSGASILLIAICICPFTLSNNDLELQIQSMSVSPFEISGGRIHAKTDLNINLTVINYKHDTDMVYDNIVLSVFYKKELILVCILPPFHQEPGEKKIRVHESVAASTGYVNNWVVVSALTSPRSVNFSVRMECRIKYFPGTSLEKIRSATVLCEDVKTEFPPGLEAGAMAGQPGVCKVWLDKA